MSNRVITAVRQFPSKSSPGKFYTVCQYDDGTSSCNCPAWTYKKGDATRTCHHVRMAAVKAASILTPVAKPLARKVHSVGGTLLMVSKGRKFRD